MPSITIIEPTSNSTVGRSFSASGSYVTAAAKDPVPQVAQYEVQCTLYDRSGHPIQTESDVLPNPLPSSGEWGVSFSVDHDYEGCSLIAELIIDTPPYATAEVTGLTVSDGCEESVPEEACAVA
jgi:hypothetical protein